MAGTSFGINPQTGEFSFGTSPEPEVPKGSLRYARNVGSNRIQWATKDAKKAGLHPLFALGGGMSNAMAPIGVGASTQVSVGPGKKDPDQARLMEAQINLLEAQTLAALQGVNNSSGAGSTNGVGLPEDIVRTPVPPKPHITETRPRGRVGADGSIDPKAYPAGTPASVDEEELGEWALITQLPRVIRYFKRAYDVSTIGQERQEVRKQVKKAIWDLGLNDTAIKEVIKKWFTGKGEPSTFKPKGRNRRNK
jgi:hypothetical protein